MQADRQSPAIDQRMELGGQTAQGTSPEVGHKAIVTGRVRAVPVWDIRPRTFARAKARQYPVDYPTIIDTRHTPRIFGKKRFDHFPPEISQLKSAASHPRRRPELE